MFGVTETRGQLLIVNRLGHEIPCDYILYSDGHMELDFQDIDTCRDITRDLMGGRVPKLNIEVPGRTQVINS